jgi:hypothetical protein
MEDDNNSKKLKKIQKNLNPSEYSEDMARKAQLLIAKLKNEKVKKEQQEKEESLNKLIDQKNMEENQE